MAEPFRVLTAASLGAGLMYLFDPNKGHRRRAILRDKFQHLVGRAEEAIGITACDIAHRAEGLAAEARSMFTSEDLPDGRLVGRVRTRMGRCISHPRGILVTADHGHVCLTGTIPADELKPLLAAVSSVRGVRSVDNQLIVFEESAESAGDGRARGRLGIMRANWSPTSRLAASAAGCALMANCWARSTPRNVLLGTLGFGLCVRAITNTPWGELVSQLGQTIADLRAIEAEPAESLAETGIPPHDAGRSSHSRRETTKT
jgi:hypothetical protein